MVPIIVILTIAVFLVVDFALRVALKKREEARLHKRRAEALDIGLKLDFTTEARSLKRVEVDKPRARILAVDDEPVVLDSFRKILVLAGYSIDTVETGPEALGLIRRNDYEFVFTDLKMPGMNGLDVTKAVKHLRPDIDVVMITGYATIESAVETMKFGAMDYVQKPFTEDELIEFADKLLIRRQARLESRTPPKVHLVTPTSTESASDQVINVPGGVFISPEHAWVGVDITGEVRVGLDDFVHKTLREFNDLTLPSEGAAIARGEPLFTVRADGRELSFSSPLSGRVSRVNSDLVYHLDLLQRRPYQYGWLCCLDPTDLRADLEALTIGAAAIGWYEEEIHRLGKALRERLAAGDRADPAGEWGAEKQVVWSAFEEVILRRGEAAVPA